MRGRNQTAQCLAEGDQFMVRLRVVSPEDWRVWREVRQRALTEAPYAFGSRLSDWQGVGDTEARWRERLRTVPLNVIAEVSGEPAGMVSGTRVDDEVELVSLWVDPQFRGTGVGDSLVEAVAGWAKSQGIGTLVLSVRAENPHARAFYQRLGFVDGGCPMPDESGVPEVRMTRTAAGRG